MTRVRLTRFVFVTILGLASHAGIASAWQITITPANPTPADPIHVVVDDGFAMGCWDVVSTSCTLASPDSVLLTAQIQYCNGQPSCFCTAFPEDFQVICDFSPLPPGTYRAVYQERYLNPADPRNAPARERIFTVSVPSPSNRRSWGRLKTIYR